jgi:hypothetical protein
MVGKMEYIEFKGIWIILLRQTSIKYASASNCHAAVSITVFSGR